MPAFLLLTVLLAAAPAPSEQCDAKPFTLGKPVKPQAPAKPAAETTKKTAEAKATEAKPKPKSKPLTDCDQPKKKG